MDAITESFVARQPILDRRERLVAYELLFRASASAGSAEISDFDSASARVIVDTFTSLGRQVMIGDALGFLNVSREVLLSDAIELLPKDSVVFEVLEHVELDAAVRRRLMQLRKRGFRIAFDDFVADGEREFALDLADYIKIDVLQYEPASLARLTRRLRRAPVVLLAEKVEEHRQAERCRKLGFELFQGYYFARPRTVSGATVDPQRRAILDVLGQLNSGVQVEAIAESFKRHAELNVNLLRLVNSVGMGSREKISTVPQALVYLGARQVQRWLTLLLFAGEARRGSAGPLLETAALRGRMMERLADAAVEEQRQDTERAFLAGMLSLVDTLLSRPLDEVLTEMNVDEEIRGALLEGRGALGALLALTRTAERDDRAELARGMRACGVSAPAFARVQGEALAWWRSLWGEDDEAES